jgi:WD40 repeat protein
MAEQNSARVLILYSLRDGAGSATELRSWLVAQGLSVWDAGVAAAGTDEWRHWRNIDEALTSDALQHVALVCTPDALESLAVRRKINLARQAGKVVSCVRPLHASDGCDVRPWLGEVFDRAVPEERDALIRRLRGRSHLPLAPMLAPEPLSGYVPPAEEFEELHRLLVLAKVNAVGLTGIGGCGKTALARAVARDFPFGDGTFWLDRGLEPRDLLAGITDLITVLTGASPGLTTRDGGAAALSEAVGERELLIVLDDVSCKRDLYPFLRLGPNASLLFTTRDDFNVPDDVCHLRLEAKYKEYELDEDRRARSEDLAVFPTGTEVPVDLVARLWAKTGGLDYKATERMLDDLARAPLLERSHFPAGALRCHDTFHHAVIPEAVQAKEVLHRRLSAALYDCNPGDRLSERYRYFHLPYHLAEGHELERLDRLLLDPAWMTAKLETTRNFAALVSDYERYGKSEASIAIGRTLKLIAHICAQDPRQLLPQLLGRLTTNEAIAGTGFLDAARRHLSVPAILEQHASLRPPGAESARLEGHSDTVSALCMMADGRLASGGSDGTIRLWDIATAVETCCLRVTEPVTSLCLLRDGDIMVGGTYGAIGAWCVEDAQEFTRLAGHSRWVSAICVLADGRVASASSEDTTIRLWDIATGAETNRLQGHSGAVSALCMLPDGRLASGGDDGTIRLWDVATGTETFRLQGHSGTASALCMLPDGRLASGGRDGPKATIRLWDVVTGVETLRLEERRGSITALCMMPDGRLASAMQSGPIRLWDIVAGTESLVLWGPSDTIDALCALPDGRLAAAGETDRRGSLDVVAGSGYPELKCNRRRDVMIGTDRAWIDDSDDEHSDFHDRELRDFHASSGSAISLLDVPAHTTAAPRRAPPIKTLCRLPDGRIVFGSKDSEIRFWDISTGVRSLCFDTRPGEFHVDHVLALCVLPDGRLAFGGIADGSIGLSDIATRAEGTRLKKHHGRVSALCVLPDGHLASGAHHDKKIRFWDVTTGSEIACLEGHSDPISALCTLSDGRLASAAALNNIRLHVYDTRDKAGHDAVRVWDDAERRFRAPTEGDASIRLWDVATGTETGRLDGHLYGVHALCVLRDGRLASGGGDGTIRLWDTKTGSESACLRGHTDLVSALCALPDGRLVSGGRDATIRIWDIADAVEIIRLEIDHAVSCLLALGGNELVAGDYGGQLHRLVVASSQPELDALGREHATDKCLVDTFDHQ